MKGTENVMLVCKSSI